MATEARPRQRFFRFGSAWQLPFGCRQRRSARRIVAGARFEVRL